MGELYKQSNTKAINIKIGHETFNIKNPYQESAHELSVKLADKIYDSIRECDTNICDITKNLGFKADNIKKVKDHGF
jgi:hypothetical protein